MNGYSMTDDTLCQMEYEMRSFPVVCSICSIADIGTQARLEADGWYLGKVEECPKCRDAKRIEECEQVIRDFTYQRAA